MIKKTLVFTNPCYLSLQNKQLVISQPDNDVRTIPIEDIGILLLEHQQITITHAVMSTLIQQNAAIITCDGSHMPVGLYMPLDGGSTQTERFRYQLEASVPLKKQLWQQTVSAKIWNQARLLEKIGIEVDNLYRWSREVRSGDSENLEGRAAAFYWQKIFSSKFQFYRNRGGIPPNNLLNYGYAILRAIVARALVSSGLLPTLGIFHRNKYNAYCLADDIMEPYRPYVDWEVYRIVEENLSFEELDTTLKLRLLKIPQVDVNFEDMTSPLLVGVSRSSASLARCFEGNARKITYPEFN